MPCERLDSKSRPRCFIRAKSGRVLFVCVLVRFKGHNSRRDRGLGMTILEKLERQGLIPNE